jgi:hypothetical protein
MSTKKSTARQRKQKCSSCGRKFVDHDGPLGRHCNMEMPQYNDDDSQIVDHTSNTSSKDQVLHELMDQMSKLTLGLQHVQDDVRDIKKDAHTNPSAGAGSGSRAPRIASDYMSAGVGLQHATTEANICLPSGAKVSQRTIAHSKSGEYINLTDYVPCLEPSLTTETSLEDGGQVFRPKRGIKSIDSFFLWSMAWRGYEEILVSHDPGLYPQLSAYRTFIQTCAAKYTWPAVCSYDVRNRGKHSMNKSFEFNIIDNDIYITTMDSSTARQNIRNCARCKSIWHVIKDCPFAEAGTLAPGARQQPASSSNQRPTAASNTRNASTQVCFNWNAGCCIPPCVRRHVCEGC